MSKSRLIMLVCGGLFMGLSLLGSMMLPGPAYALPPTPTPTAPETNYNAANILATLQGITVVSTPAFQSANIIPNVVDTTVYGGGIANSLIRILSNANVPIIFAGIAIGLMVIFWLRLRLNKWLQNVNPAAYQMRQQRRMQIRSDREVFRKELRAYRSGKPRRRSRL